MTTSTDNQTTTPKKVKAKGPIRTEAVVPIAIVLGLTYAYFHFFFDAHVRKGIEWTATYIHGAEVNLGGLRSSFWAGSIRLNDLQVTDKAKPTQNLVQIGEIRFDLNWDALLRLKFVVEDSGIDGIQIYSPRKRAGYVRPPEPPETAKPGSLDAIQANALKQTQDQFNGNVLGDVAKLLEGTDSKELLKSIEGELQSEKKIKDLTAELKGKEAEWKSRFDKLPQKAEFEELARRAKALNLKEKDPKKLAANVKELSKIAKEADQKFDEIKKTSDDLNADLKRYNTEFNSIDDLIKSDIKLVETRLNIPDFDAGDFSKDLFGKMFAGKVGQVQKYMTLARKYMPPEKSNGEKSPELVPPKRGQGKNYKFPITTGYPLFWWKRATISSKATNAGFSGNLSGSLTDVTTDPTVIGRPAVLDIKGDFPHSEISGAALKLTVDHVREPRELLEISVAQFPVRDFSITDSPDVGLAMKQALGQSNLVASLQNATLTIDLENQFNSLSYDVKAKSSLAKEALDSILAGIPSITLNAEARGTWDDIDLHINSNLGKELSRGFGRFVKAKVDEMRRQIKEQIDARVGTEKAKLEAEYAKVKKEVDKVIGDKKSEVDAAKNDVKSATSGQKSAAKDQLKKDLKEKGKKLLKGLKF